MLLGNDESYPHYFSTTRPQIAQPYAPEIQDTLQHRALKGHHEKPQDNIRIPSEITNR